MIARLVHKHTPEAQLELAPFKGFLMKNNDVKNEKREPMIDIDMVPEYVS
jgi:hypothetical protein